MGNGGNSLKVILFDARDTLGEEAELSQDPKTGKPLTIGDYVDDQDIITNHEASAALGHLVQKPDPEIDLDAAQRLEFAAAQCLFVGENLVENLGATAAGMQILLKPSPPDREFAPALVGRIDAIAKALGAITEGKAPPLDEGRWVSPGKVTLPDELRRAMAYFVHLNNHFADQVHLQAEESMIEVAVACGMPLAPAQWILDQHEQARAYVRAINAAWGRIERGDDDDRYYALIDFRRGAEGLDYLFEAHVVRENDQMDTEAGGFFNDTDDAMVMNRITHFGPADITPFVGMLDY